MAKVWKVLIRPGAYQAPQGRLEATASRCRRWAATFQRMKRAGIRVPVCWGHQPGAIPGENADKATRQYLLSKYNAGYLDDLVCGPDGALKALLDVPGAERDREGNLVTWAKLPDGRKVPCAIKEVSAAIRDWRDGKGRDWPDAIIHVALVTLPVMAEQEGFAAAGAGNDTNAGGPGEVHLSLSDLLYTLGTETNMPDDLMLEEPDLGAGMDTPNGRLTRTLSVLKQFGIHLPPDTNEGNLSERIDLIGNALIQAGVAPGMQAGAAGGMEPDGDEGLEMEGEEGLDDLGDEEGLDDLGDEGMGDDEGLFDEGGDDLGDDEGLDDLDDLGDEGEDDEEAHLADDDAGLDDEGLDEEGDGEGATVSGDSDAMPGDEEEDEDEDAEEEPRPIMMSTTSGKPTALRTPMEKALGKKLARAVAAKRRERLERVARHLPRHQVQELRKKVAAAPVRLARTRGGVEAVKEVVDFELSTIEGLVRDGALGRGRGGRRAERPDAGENDAATRAFLDEQVARANGEPVKRRKKK